MINWGSFRRRLSPRLLLVLVGCEAIMPTGQPSRTIPPATITGRERIGWDQQAIDADQLASFHYAVYVDGERSELNDVSCETTAGPQGFACTAALPSMSLGAHTLAVRTFIRLNDGVRESLVATSLAVNVVAATSAGARLASGQGVAGPMTTSDRASTLPGGMVVTTIDHVQLRLDLVVDGLDQPSDVAFAPDGRILIAERTGRVRVVHDGSLQPEPALTLDDITTSGQGGLVALVLDPQFERTHFVYMIYTRSARSGESVFCLARFREANDMLAGRVILLDNISASPTRPTASLRFGPEGKLYAAFDDGGDARRAGDMGSFNGKILRLNPDGTTPDDQAGYTPVYASDYRSPRGLDWQPGTGTLWIADGDSGGSVRLNAVGSGDNRMKRGAVKATYALPPPSEASSLSFYTAGLIPAFRDNLLVARDAGGNLLRIRFSPLDPTRILATERLLQDRLGGVLVVAAPSDGAIYVCTAHALVRIAPTGTATTPR